MVYFVLLNNYDSFSRAFLTRIAESLGVSYASFLSMERSLISSLSLASTSNAKDYDEMKQKLELERKLRIMVIRIRKIQKSR